MSSSEPTRRPTVFSYYAGGLEEMGHELPNKFYTFRMDAKLALLSPRTCMNKSQFDSHR